MRALLISMVLFVVALFATPAIAHNTSVTHIDLKFERETLAVTIQLHQADMLEHALGASHEKFTDRAELEDMAPQVLSYVLSKFVVQADGKALTGTAVNWPPQYVDLKSVDTRGLETPGLIPMELRYALPAEAKTIEIKPELFAGMNFAAIFDVSIAREGHPTSSVVVDRHRSVKVDLSAIETSNKESDRDAQSLWATILSFVVLGFYHIVPEGLDHILFVLGLYFLSPKLKDLFWQVTAFTVAHSMTLALAAFNVFTLPARFVEPMIALSITAIAVENLLSKGKPVRRWRWVLVFGFGLVHGLGFADVLHEVDLPAGQALGAILSFNVGVEAGQIAVLIAVMALTKWWQKREWYFNYIAAPASLCIACMGAFWAIERVIS